MEPAAKLVLAWMQSNEPREWSVFDAKAYREDVPLPLNKPVQSRTDAALTSAARPHSKVTHVSCW